MADRDPPSTNDRSAAVGGDPFISLCSTKAERRYSTGLRQAEQSKFARGKEMAALWKNWRLESLFRDP